MLTVSMAGELEYLSLPPVPRKKPTFRPPTFDFSYYIGRSPHTTAFVRGVLQVPHSSIPPQDMQWLLGHLTAAEREVVVRYYALHGGKRHSFVRLAFQGHTDVYSIGKVWILAVTKLRGAYKRRPLQTAPLPVSPEELIATGLPEQVADWPATLRSRNALRRSKLEKTAQVMALTNAELAGLPNIGEKSLAEILHLLGRT